MRIVRDEPKRLANLDRHGMDFDDLASEFFEVAVIIPARWGRLMAIGRLHGHGPLAVVFVRMGSEALSIVSMRAAGEKERRLLR